MAVTLHTSLGDLKLELFCTQVPKLCENFLALAAAGVYNGTRFHRNIKAFMVQGGDPTNTGKGGESVWGGKMEDEFNSNLKHSTRGIVSMANSGPDSNGSQFFITYKAHPHLDNVYSVIGQVIHGFPVLDNFERTPTDNKNRPLQEIILKDITIHANPLA